MKKELSRLYLVSIKSETMQNVAAFKRFETANRKAANESIGIAAIKTIIPNRIQNRKKYISLHHRRIDTTGSNPSIGNQ